MKLFFVGCCQVAFVLLSFSASAEVIPVLTVTTDAYSGTSYIDVERTTTGEITAMIYRPSDRATQYMTLDELSRAPQVLKEASGRKVITLQIYPGFTPERGGYARMRFLQSGMSEVYRNFRILIDNQKDVVLRSDPDRADRESDHNRYTSVFNRLFLRGNWFFGKLIGISRVEPSYRQGLYCEF